MADSDIDAGRIFPLQDITVNQKMIASDKVVILTSLITQLEV